MEMKMKAAGWVLAAVFSAVVCACGSGKQEAAVLLDEARLNISSARKAGAESSSPTRLAQAVTALTAAEADFKSRNYAQAQSSAQTARDAAQQAENEAKAKAAADKTPARAKRRAGRK